MQNLIDYLNSQGVNFKLMISDLTQAQLDQVQTIEGVNGLVDELVDGNLIVSKV